MKALQATGEVFNPQKRTSSAIKVKFINCFLFFWVIFALLDPDPDSGAPLNPDPIRIRIRIHNTDEKETGQDQHRRIEKRKDQRNEGLGGILERLNT
jgi:hypothetical protein